jgi:hypothetical protein
MLLINVKYHTRWADYGLTDYVPFMQVCRLCSTDKLKNVEQHCQTREHLRYNQQVEVRCNEEDIRQLQTTYLILMLHLLQQRRNELIDLVAETEQRLLDERKQEELQTSQRKQEAKDAVEEYKTSHDNFSKQITATERRASLKESRGYRMEEQRRLRRERPAEDLSAKRSSETSVDRARQLRSERLLSQKKQATSSSSKHQKTSEEKLQEKELRRLAVLETTKRHHEMQKKEEEDLKQIKEEGRKGQMGEDTFLGCLPSSFCESNFCTSLCGFTK